MSNARFELNGLATAIGSMPHADPQEACSLVTIHFPDIPAWPQLPNRSFTENMYAQFSKGFPGVVLEKARIWIDRSRDLSEPLEQVYAAYLENNIDSGALSHEYAEGFHVFRDRVKKVGIRAVKGQVTGPISFGLTVTDQDRRPLLYDEVLADALAKHLRLKAAWQERELRKICPDTIISVDEPYLSSFGSAYVSISREQAVTLLDEVLGGISGLKAIHCCGNTDWSVVLQTSLDILSFDAYNYGETIALYPSEIGDFLSRGGVIAWGIVPNDEPSLDKETEESLIDRLENTMTLLSDKGIGYDTITAQCLITPSCGLGSISKDAAAKAMELTAGVSKGFRNKLAG